MASTLLSRSFLTASLLSKRGLYSQLGSSSFTAFKSTTWALRAMASMGLGRKVGYSTSSSSELTNERVVSVDWLHSNLRQPDLKVLDASWYTPEDQRNQFQEYKVAHIPGALFFDLDGISDRRPRLPHVLPSEEAFAAGCSALGIKNKDGVIVYDAEGIFSAARLWWMFKVYGHDKVWVLDGGLPKWRASGYDVEPSASGDATEKIYQGQNVSPITFKTKFQPYLVWTLDQHLPTNSNNTRFFTLSENKQPMGEVAEQACGFHVTTTKKQVITAALPHQEHWLPFSNFDLLLPPIHVSGWFCYKKPLNMTNSAALETLKTSLAETLVSYYALAGEIVTNPAGESGILCSNRGVDFEEASTDVELRDLNFYDPDDSIAKLVPIMKHGVLAIQVTQLKCGSIIVGCTFDHRVADGASMNMFLMSWAEISRSDIPVSCVPSFQKSLLNPRRPLVMDPDSSIDQMYMPATSLPPPQELTTSDNSLASGMFYIKADAIEELQTLANSSKSGKRTKLESFSAFIWKLVAAHAAKDGVSSKNSQLGIVVDGRKRLLEQENHSYFGNILSVPYGGLRIDDLINKPLSWVAQEVHRFLEGSLTKEHFLNLIDYVEIHRPTPIVSTMFKTDGPAFVVSSGRNFQVTKMDFGWGSPVFGSYLMPWGGGYGYVLPMPSTIVDGDWIVYMRFTKGQFKFIEEEASHVFKPIDNDYLRI